MIVPLSLRCLVVIICFFAGNAPTLCALDRAEEISQGEEREKEEENQGPWWSKKKIALAVSTTLLFSLLLDRIVRSEKSLLSRGYRTLAGEPEESSELNELPAGQESGQSHDALSAKTGLSNRDDVRHRVVVSLGSGSKERPSAKPTADYFKLIMGKPETEVVAAIIKKLKEQGYKEDAFYYYYKNEEVQAIVSSVMDELFPPAQRPASVTTPVFKQYTIRDLQKETDAMSAVSDTPSFTFLHDPACKLTRVEYLQGLPENRDAVFQVASNHNALEGHPYAGTSDILNHWRVGVQGELATLSAAGAAIQRIYLHKPIDLLQDFKGDYADIAVGLHENALVTSCYKDTTHEYYSLSDPDQRIHQLFAFGYDYRNIDPQHMMNQWAYMRDNVARGKKIYGTPVSVNYGKNHGNMPELVTTHGHKKLEEMFLKAAYEGTLRAAVKAGKKKVFLTVIGGGVFYDRLDVVQEAIVSMKDFIKAKGLQVTLVYFKDRTPEVVQGENERFKQAMRALESELRAPAPLVPAEGRRGEREKGLETTTAVMSNQKSPTAAFAVIMGATEEAINQKLIDAFKEAGKKYPQDLSDTIDLVQKIAPPPAIVTQGTHEILSIEELEDACKEQPPFERDNRKFQVITGSVADLQASKEYRDALFQVASNDNGIEGTVSYGGSVAGLSASLQGQTASFSTLGRTIYSMRYRPRINLKDKYVCKVGDTEAYKKLKIDLHSDIQVTNGESDGQPNYLNPLQRITQAVTFAFPHPNKSNPLEVARAKDYLKAAYRGTLLSAVAKRKKKVILTLMGGGAFHNPLSWIEEAIKDCTDLIEKYNLNVALVLYNLHEFIDKPSSDERNLFYQRMATLSKAIVNTLPPTVIPDLQE